MIIIFNVCNRINDSLIDSLIPDDCMFVHLIQSGHNTSKANNSASHRLYYTRLIYHTHAGLDILQMIGPKQIIYFSIIFLQFS